MLVAHVPWGSGEFALCVEQKQEDFSITRMIIMHSGPAARHNHSPRALLIGTYSSDTTHVQSACSPVHTRSL